MQCAKDAGVIYLSALAAGFDPLRSHSSPPRQHTYSGEEDYLCFLLEKDRDRAVKRDHSITCLFVRSFRPSTNQFHLGSLSISRIIILGVFRSCPQIHDWKQHLNASPDSNFVAGELALGAAPPSQIKGAARRKPSQVACFNLECREVLDNMVVLSAFSHWPTFRPILHAPLGFCPPKTHVLGRSPSISSTGWRKDRRGLVRIGRNTVQVSYLAIESY